MVLAWALIGLAIAATPLPTPCGTPRHIHQAFNAPIPPPAPPGGALTDRDPFGEFPNKQYSEHFVLKWGPSFSVSESQSDAMLAYFERALRIQVDEWDLADPTEFGGTYFNVYIGNTGGPSPSDEGNAGYYTKDEEGYPYIVLAQSSANDLSYGESVIAHEFFHAVQMQSGAFQTWDTGGWYWEASATWAQGELTDHWANYGFLGFYALQPDEGLYHYGYTDHSGAPPDLHQYGAFIFLRHISEHRGEAEIITQTWRDGAVNDDPLRTFDTVYGDIFIGDIAADAAARNLLWDYENGGQYRGHIEDMSGMFPGSDQRHATLTEHALPGWYTVPLNDQPKPYGYNLIALPDGTAEAGVLTLQLQHDVSGEEEPSLEFRGRIAEITPTGVVYYHEIIPDLQATEITLANPNSELWLVVVNTNRKVHALDEMPYRFSFSTAPVVEDTGIGDTGGDSGTTTSRGPPMTGWYDDDDDDDDNGKGCACSSSAGTSGLYWMMLGVLLLRRRSDIPTA